MVDGMSKGKRRHALPKRWFLGDVVKKVGAGRRVAGIHLRLVVFYSAGGVLPTTGLGSWRCGLFSIVYC